MAKNLKYFECMFREGSNFVESKIVNQNQSGDTRPATSKKLPEISIEMPNPKCFAQYLEFVYSGKLDLEPSNCCYFYYIADYLQDTAAIQLIETYIYQNIKYENIVEIMNQTDKFDKEIVDFLRLNRKNVPKDVPGDLKMSKFCKNMIELSYSRVVKLMLILESVFGSNWANTFYGVRRYSYYTLFREEQNDNMRTRRSSGEIINSGCKICDENMRKSLTSHQKNDDDTKSKTRIIKEIREVGVSVYNKKGGHWTTRMQLQPIYY